MQTEPVCYKIMQLGTNGPLKHALVIWLVCSVDTIRASIRPRESLSRSLVWSKFEPVSSAKKPVPEAESIMDVKISILGGKGSLVLSTRGQ